MKNKALSKVVSSVNKNYFILIFCVLFLMFLTRYYLVGYGIGSDGDWYYMYLPSIILDHDLNFSNQITQFPWMNIPNRFAQPENQMGSEALARYQEEIAKEPIVNKWPIGTAIFLAPFFIISHIIVVFINFFGFHFLTNGYSAIHQIGTMMGSIIYSTIGLYLSYKIAKRWVRQDKIVKLAILLLVPSSFLIQYIAIEPSMSHAVSFFVSTLFFYVFLTKIHSKVPSLFWYCTWGLISGLMVSVRHQNSINLIFPAVLFLWDIINKKYSRKHALYTLLSVLCFVIGLLPLLITSFLSYGNIFGTGFTSEISLHEFNLLPLLFSFQHSLFVTTPLMLLSTIGLIILLRKKRDLEVKWAFVFTLLAHIVFNSFLITWSAASSFGARRFSNVFGIFIIGFSYLLLYIQKQKKTVKVASYFVLLSLLGFNLIYLISYNLNLISRYDVASYATILKNFFNFLRSLLGRF